MDYNLNDTQATSIREAFRKMLTFMKGEKKRLYFAFFVMLLNSVVTLIAPLIIGYTIDHYIVTKMYHEVLLFCGLLLVLYIVSAITDYFQTKLMGSIGQWMLYHLRNAVFSKIQDLPVAFFNQNKTGDLISRINNDTQAVNQFFSQQLLRFVNSIFMMLVSAGFLLAIHPSLGGASIAPAIIIILFVKVVNPWVRKKNKISLKMAGLLSGEAQESLSNFKTIIAFNRRDFFEEKFKKSNSENYKAAVITGMANGIYTPFFTLLSNIAQLIVLTYGIYLISTGSLTIGLLISYIAYVQSFYRPLQQMAVLWANFQNAMAAWDRIAVILNLKSNLLFKETTTHGNGNASSVISLRDVSFGYDANNNVLEHINIELERGKTYAFVGPTGGGKSTTASLIARLYDPNEGEIKLNGIPIKDYSAKDLSEKIGFILQEPFVFQGTLKENILYGRDDLIKISDQELEKILSAKGLEHLIQRFDDGLHTQIADSDGKLSLGEKQLIAFVRAVLREPELLIMDEASANIDTVTEQSLDEIISKLPTHTTKLIIAHRLNTIANADEIYFVNAGRIKNAGTLQEATDMLIRNKRNS